MNTEDIFKIWDKAKDNVGFAHKVIDPDDESRCKELFDMLADRDYVAITLIGTAEDQMCGMVGQKQALIYLLASTMLKDKDFLPIVLKAISIVQGMAYHFSQDKKKDEHGKQETN